MGTASQLLDLIERQGILSRGDVLSLREQIDDAETPVHPVFLSRRLVQLGYLNPYHAKTLLEEIAKLEPATQTAAQSVAAKGSDEIAPELEPLEEEKEKDESADRWKETPAEDPEPPPVALDDLVLPPISTVDVFSDPALTRARLIPSLRKRSPWSTLVPRRSRTSPRSRDPVVQLLIMSLVAVIAAAVVGLIIFIVTRP